MLTGDNLFTGIHIVRTSGIMHSNKGVLLGVLNQKGNVTDMAVELAMSGEAWQVLLCTEKKYALAPFIRVFGRCSPLDKVSVVDAWIRFHLGFTTMMHGDGGTTVGPCERQTLD